MALSSMTSRTPLRYGCALLSVALVVVIRALLQPLLDTQAPLLLFTLAVMTSAWYGGLGPGLLATCLSAFVGGYFFMEPVASVAVADVRDRVVLALFVIVGVMISVLSQSLRSSRQRVEDSARELRESEERYRSLFDSIDEGYCIIELIFDEHEKPVDYRFLQVSPSFEKQTGLKDATGKTALELIPNLEPHWFEIFGEITLTGEPVRFENRAEQLHRWYDVYAFRLGEPEKRQVAILFNDITERRSMEEASAELLTATHRARAEAEEANRLKDEFLATVSHELRTPLASMLMWTRMLESGSLDRETTGQAHATLAGNVKLLSHLIKDLLDVSRIISGKLRVEPRPTHLVPIIEAAIEVARPAADAKAIEIKTVFDPAVDDVSGDANRLQQVFWNLLSNAVKFTPPEGSIEIRLERVDSHARVSVSDTGIGIREEALPRIFDRFYQVKEEGGGRGLGLGLAIVRHLVEMHGGRVEAASPGEGRGATFTVNLPLMTAKAETTTSKPELKTGAATFDCPATLEGVRVLVVDDNTDARQITAMVLESCGARVEQAASSAEALELMMEETAPRWEVFVFDIEMPGADGYELIRRVRSLDAERGGNLPTLALTAHAGAEDSRRCLAAGYQAHLAKPVEPSVLVETIARLAGRADQTLSAKNSL